jgi:peroxiredoxin
LALPVFEQWSALVPEVGLLGISQDTSSETAEFFEEMGIEMPVAFDHEPYPASAAFDIDAVPAWFLLQDGEVSWSWAGWNAEKAAELTAILGEKVDTDIALDDLDALPAFRPG